MIAENHDSCIVKQGYQCNIVTVQPVITHWTSLTSKTRTTWHPDPLKMIIDWTRISSQVRRSSAASFSGDPAGSNGLQENGEWNSQFCVTTTILHLLR